MEEFFYEQEDYILARIGDVFGDGSRRVRGLQA